MRQNKAEREAAKKLLAAPHLHPFLRQRYVEALDIDAVTEWDANPNEGDIGKLHELIDENGFYGAILVQEKTPAGEKRMRIFGGNHRHRTMRQKGAKVIPAFLYEIDDEAAMRIMLGDNIPGRLNRDNDDTLARLLQALNAHTGTLRGTGRTNDDLQDILTRLSFKEKDAEKKSGSKYTKPDKSEAEAWPVIQIRVPHAVLAQFTDVMDPLDGKPWERLAIILTDFENNKPR